VGVVSACYTIDLVGDLTIVGISAAHATILRALTDSASVVVSVAPDAAVDLTFVQLLESARRTAGDEGRELALAAPAAGRLRETLERGGFLGASDRRAFWLMQEEA
jgi:hypothetical protein